MARARLRLVAALAGLVALGGCSGDDASTTPRADDSPSASVSLPAAQPVDDRVQATIPITGGPDWLATDGRYVYVKRDNGVVSAVDPATNREAWSVSTGSALCQGVGAGFGAIWVCAANDSTGNDDVMRIDVATRKVVATIAAAKNTTSGRIVIGSDRVWVVGAGADSTLVGIDPTTNAVVDRIPLDALVYEIAADQNEVWAVSSADGELLRVDPKAGEVSDRFAVSDEPSALALGELVWVSGKSTTVGLDRANGEEVHEVPVGAGPEGALAIGSDELWVRSADPLLTRIEPATGAVTDRLTSTAVSSVGDVLSAFGSVWTSGSDDDVVIRVAP